VHLATLDGGRVHYLDKIGGRFATSVPSRVGGHAPAHSTALGKSMLAWLSPEMVDEQIGAAMPRMTSSTIVDLNGLHQELSRVRSRRGLAFERGECFEHIACAAAAVHAPEGPIGAISLVGEAGTQLERVAPLVLDAARQVSLAMYPDLESRRPRNARGHVARVAELR
jgi:DNA-binding IclR family transcriptional regulator